MKEVFGSR